MIFTVGIRLINGIVPCHIPVSGTLIDRKFVIEYLEKMHIDQESYTKKHGFSSIYLTSKITDIENAINNPDDESVFFVPNHSKDDIWLRNHKWVTDDFDRAQRLADLKNRRFERYDIRKTVGIQPMMVDTIHRLMTKTTDDH